MIRRWRAGWLPALMAAAVLVGCSRAEPGTPAAGAPISSSSSGSSSASTRPTTQAPSATVVVTQLVTTTAPPAPTPPATTPPTMLPTPPTTSAAPLPPAPPSAAPAQWTSDPNAVGGPPVPAFPDTLANWRLNTTWDTTTRAFDTDWTEIPGSDEGRFPSTMNGCDQQRFLIRWRSLDTAAQIDARWIDDAGTPGDTITAPAGWFDLDGCETPQLHFAGSDGISTLSDVAVSVQQYYPAA